MFALCFVQNLPSEMKGRGFLDDLGEKSVDEVSGIALK
jgi:hypothetical protein